MRSFLHAVVGWLLVSLPSLGCVHAQRQAPIATTTSPAAPVGLAPLRLRAGSVPLGDAPVRGAAAARVTLVIFGDHASTYTSTCDALLAEVMSAFPGDVRIVWKESRFGVSDNQRPLALAARAAHQQGRFWPMHDLLNVNIPLAWGRTPTPEEIERIAQRAGLDLPAFRAALSSPLVSEAIEKEAALADQLGVRDVPWVFVNGGELGPVRQVSDLVRAVDRALAETARASSSTELTHEQAPVEQAGCDVPQGVEPLTAGAATLKPACTGLWVDASASPDQLDTARYAWAEAARYASGVFPNLRTMPLRV